MAGIPTTAPAGFGLLSPMPSDGGQPPKTDQRRDPTIEWVESFAPARKREARSRRQTLELLQGTETPFDRRHYDPGHVTASGLVLSPDSHSVLLVFHRRLQAWLQPGGHVDKSDPDVVTTAVREVREETGVTVANHSTPVLVAVDVHLIPANRREPAHLHHDLMFRFTATSETLEAAEEVRDVVWCPLHRLTDYPLDEPLLNGLERAVLPDSR